MNKTIVRKSVFSYNLHMLIGCARVSTEDQNLDLQCDVLKAAGCLRIFEEKESERTGSKRPALQAALDFLRTVTNW